MLKTQAAKSKCAFSYQTILAATLVASLVVSACSSSGSSPTADPQYPSASEDTGPEGLIVTGFGDSNSDATSPWLVNSYIFRMNSRLDTVGEASVKLLQYSDGFEVARHVSFYTPKLDVCEIDNPDSIPTGGEGGGDSGNRPPAVSGGSSVFINSPSGSWFILTRSTEDGNSIYETFDGLPAELLPEGATLSIPGDDFPSVSAHPLYNPEPLERLLPDADAPLTADSAYSWIPGTNKTYIVLDFLAYDENNNFVDFAGFCKLKDDGSFSMPPLVKEFIGNTRFRIQARYTRTYERVDFVNGIVLRQRSDVAE